MVGLATVEEHNARFARQDNAGKVAVFVGATNGIGEATLEVMASLLQRPTLYVVGRSASRFQSQRVRLREVNPAAKVIFIEEEISLMSGVDRACKQVQAAESHLDYLFMSAGFLPVAGPEYTPEGLEVSLSVDYYSRLRFIANLLPLLRKASSPRVLSVLNGGKERKLDEDDLGLEKHWGTWPVVYHSTTMGTLSLYHLSEHEKRITFIHSFPGFVNTYNPRRRKPPPSSGVLLNAWMYVISALITVAWAFMAISAVESGKRQAYQLTSERFNPGMWRIDDKCESWSATTTPSKLVEDYRHADWPNYIWDHTKGVWARALGE